MNHIDALLLIDQGGKSAEKGMKIIFESFYPKFKNKFLRAGITESQAEDLAGDTILKIFKTLHSKEPEKIPHPVAFPSWAFIVADNTIKDYFYSIKRKIKEITIVDVSDENENIHLDNAIDDSQMDFAKRHCLMQQIKKFYKDHPERAACLEHIIYEGDNTIDISKILGRNLGATREYISQCRKHLYKYLQECL